MRVQDVMRKAPKCCGPGTNMAAATELLWENSCGALPVVDAGGNVLGIITDRDICVALGTRDRRPSELVAEEVMSRQVAMCGCGEDIHAALNIMRARRVRRMPVLGAQGKLEGILCLSDLIVAARHDDGSRLDLSYEDVMSALKCIYGHCAPAFATVN